MKRDGRRGPIDRASGKITAIRAWHPNKGGVQETLCDSEILRCLPICPRLVAAACTPGTGQQEPSPTVVLTQSGRTHSEESWPCCVVAASNAPVLKPGAATEATSSLGAKSPSRPVPCSPKGCLRTLVPPCVVSRLSVGNSWGAFFRVALAWPSWRLEQSGKANSVLPSYPPRFTAQRASCIQNPGRTYPGLVLSNNLAYNAGYPYEVTSTSSLEGEAGGQEVFS
jgi:hypothetical protein